jgi:energy-coupling factor transport system permease protein
MFHPIAWLTWLVGAMAPALLTRNPLILTVLLLVTAVVYNALGARSPLAGGWASLVRLALVLWGFSLVFDGLTNHFGATPLIVLPREWPIVGGPITAEALLFGLSSGLALASLVLIFATFNAVADHYRLLRMVPAAFYHAAVVAAIALTFVPQTVASLQDIREAQTLRGHRFRGLRDLLPLFLPLLSSGLERAIQLAESMEARGFAHTDAPLPGAGTRLGLVAGALSCGAGAFVGAYFPAERAAGLVLLLGGAGLLAGGLWRLGQGVRRSRYRRLHWQRRDSLVATAGGLVAGAFVATALLAPARLAFDPYPRATWPPFDPLVGLALLPLLAPIVKGVNS